MQQKNKDLFECYNRNIWWKTIQKQAKKLSKQNIINRERC